MKKAMNHGQEDKRQEIQAPQDDKRADASNALEEGDDLAGEEPFDEFEAYAQLAAGARIHGEDRAPVAMKMRGNREAGAGRKFNKPAHKDKRGP